MRFEIIIAVKISVLVSWVVMICGLAGRKGRLLSGGMMFIPNFMKVFEVV
jgi:hypothetical protein